MLDDSYNKKYIHWGLDAPNVYNNIYYERLYCGTYVIRAPITRSEAETKLYRYQQNAPAYKVRLQ